MKTLDEVIYHLENCAYAPLTDDALHYLKVLQKMQKAQPLEKSEWDKLYNQPLTWQELKGMEGKPVWVEYTYQGEWRPDKGEWIIINLMGDDDLIDQTGEGLFPKSLYGKTWQAYRKELE